MSQSRRAAIECIFGCGKQHGTLRKIEQRGIARVAADFLLNLTGYCECRVKPDWQLIYKVTDEGSAACADGKRVRTCLRIEELPPSPYSAGTRAACCAASALLTAAAIT